MSHRSIHRIEVRKVSVGLASTREMNPQTPQENQVVVPIPLLPPNQPSGGSIIAPPPNLPCGELIEGSREEYVKIGVPLYEASRKGDWEAAKAILDQKPELVRFAITENFDTPLHIAASVESTVSVVDFVRNLVERMEKKDLELQNNSYNTALCLAATAGNVQIAKIIVEKNKAVLEIPGKYGILPLYVAAVNAKDEMLRYLYDYSNKMSGDFWTNDNRGWVLKKCVAADIFDVALKILNDRPELTAKKKLLRDILLLLAEKTDVFIEKKPQIILRFIKSIFHVEVGQAETESDALQFLKKIWQNTAIMPKNEIDEILQGPAETSAADTEGGNRKTTYPSRILFVAAKCSNTRFIIHLFQSYPDLAWKVNDQGLTIFHIAVIRRDAEIYNLLYEIGSQKDLITPIKDGQGNNMLHLVAKGHTAERFQNVSGVALQMQHELLWFKEVEKMISPTFRQRKNKDGETPHELFTRTHRELVSEGERWMKDTAPQCMVVATLIATMVFAAAFTLPGGYDQNTGLPTFRQKPALMVFVIADAISLIFSSATVLTFLSIFTSRYAENDFLESLPKTLMFGLGTLFISIMTMMITFSASFFVLYTKHSLWVPIMVTAFAAMPLFLFASQQFRFLGDIFYATYRSKYLFKPKKRMLQ